MEEYGVVTRHSLQTLRPEVLRLVSATQMQCRTMFSPFRKIHTVDILPTVPDFTPFGFRPTTISKPQDHAGPIHSLLGMYRSHVVEQMDA